MVYNLNQDCLFHCFTHCSHKNRQIWKSGSAPTAIELKILYPAIPFDGSAFDNLEILLTLRRKDELLGGQR